MIHNRKLGRLEQAMETLNSQAKTWNIVTISRIKGALSKEVLRQSLDKVQCRHPRLNSHIVRSQNRLYFQTEGTAKIALRVVKKLSDEQWTEVVDEEMNEKIDSSKCLMRVVLVHFQNQKNISYLITTVHHAIADALSCIQLHSEILTNCQKVVSGEEINLVNLSPLPPIEEIIPKWTKGLKSKINNVLFLLQLGFQKIWYQPKTLDLENYVPVAQRRCHIIHRQLDPDVTQKFINLCRQENTTVHSALCAAMIFTVARKITQGNKKDIQVSCLSYLDLRRRLKPTISDEHLAVLAASMMGFHTIKTNTSFWELARNVKQKLEDGTQRGDIFKMMLVAKHLIDFCFRQPKQVAATVSVSNIGKVSIPKFYGEFELEEISFAGSHALYAGVFIIHAATFQGKMLLNFVFSQPAISQETIEVLVNELMSFIREMCDFNLNLCFTCKRYTSCITK
ncbi:phthiocerol/phthiodiolone dimycocerosyl transferase family protein [Halotia branconii]|uniref:Phthiocerol/phthiodiolone dimycocerosyl transferase n=1 Tax=Halotia branconii CENA392 TaxID=1539056 RepID=A0AAJ6NYT9_9CYAN|nr:condensation domain-containing protein [Halotia branconii]WGV28973.1 condensation domain-containing protein [Halotia branconii CENA392]